MRSSLPKPKLMALPSAELTSIDVDRLRRAYLQRRCRVTPDRARLVADLHFVGAAR